MPTNQTSAPIKIEADTSSFDAAMRDILASTEQFGRIFASSLRVAAISGRDFDDTLRSIALRISSLALNKAFQPLDELFGSLISSVGQSILGGSPASASPVAPQSHSASIVFNVQTPDAAGFRKSESQISSMLARAVARGSRGL